MPPVKTLKNDTAVIVPQAGETYVSEDGTVSQVLDDQIDANYEPTEEEVLEFADWIGMKLPQDSEFLWLAREGLKTALPKEWKPCSTNDGEVYYFNFKTGESSWDHPMDSLFRQRFEQEKEKAHRAGAKGGGTVSKAAANASTAGGTGSGKAPGTSGSSAVVPQSRVVITDSGITKRETGAAAFAAPATAGDGAREKGQKEDTKSGMHYPPQYQSQSMTSAPSSGRSNPTPANELFASAAASAATPAAAGRTSPLVIGGGSNAGRPATAGLAAGAPHRIVSEAERNMEERVQRDVRQALEAEKAKLAETHQATLDSLQQLQEKDLVEMHAADAARRASSSKQEEEERERRLQQTREKCEEQYGDELRTMEREEATLKSKLQKLEAEATRAATGNTQRAQIENEMQAALARQRAELEASSKRQHEAAMAAAEAAHKTTMEKSSREGQEKVSTSQQASQRKMDAEERSLALSAEATKQQLESQLKELERKLVGTAVAKSSAAAAASSSAASAPSAATNGATETGAALSLSEELARIAIAKAAQLRDVEAGAAKEMNEARARGEAELAAITKQPLSPGTPQSATVSRGPSFSVDRPMTISVQGGSVGGSRPTSATLSVAYTQELNRIRMARAKERQERLARLRIERDAALAATTPKRLLSTTVSPRNSIAQSDATSASARSNSVAGAGNLPPTCSVEELKAAHAAELEAKKALYAKLEAELAEQLKQEAAAAASATTAEQQSALVAKAVEAEMELYTQEVEARHARMLAEAEAKRDKQLADHQLAMEAYERKKKEAEARQAREEQEAKEAYIQEKVDAAVAAETKKLTAEHATAVARRTARYEEERDAAKAEVDEELEAYEAAERQKILATAASAMPAPVSTQASPATAGAAVPTSPAVAATAAATAAVEAQCAQLAQGIAARETQWLADKQAEEARQAGLEASRAALAKKHQEGVQQLATITKENERLATAATTAAAAAATAKATADAQREKARLVAITAATPPASPTNSVAAPPPGYRLRATHEAAMTTLEGSYSSQQTTLEAELQTWRGKNGELLQKQQQRQQTQRSLSAAPALAINSNANSNALNTPRQQVLAGPASVGMSGGASAVIQATAGATHHYIPYAVYPSPIPTAAAGSSLQNTPVLSLPFADSPWQPRHVSPPRPFGHSGLGLPLYARAASQAGPAAAPLTRPGTGPSTRDALEYYNEHQQSLQQRQAALLAAREAWQLQRRREMQQQQQQLLQLQLRQQQQQHNSAVGAQSTQSLQSGGHSSMQRSEDGAARCRTLTPQRQPDPREASQLSLVLSKLSSQLDAMTGQAEQLPHRRSRSDQHADARHRVDGVRDDRSGASPPRTHSSAARHAHHRSLLPQQQHRSTSSAGANAATRASLSSSRLSLRSPPLRSGNGTRPEEKLSTKWDSLLRDKSHK